MVWRPIESTPMNLKRRRTRGAGMECCKCGVCIEDLKKYVTRKKAGIGHSIPYCVPCAKELNLI